MSDLLPKACPDKPNRLSSLHFQFGNNGVSDCSGNRGRVPGGEEPSVFSRRVVIEQITLLIAGKNPRAANNVVGVSVDCRTPETEGSNGDRRELKTGEAVA